MRDKWGEMNLKHLAKCLILTQYRLKIDSKTDKIIKSNTSRNISSTIVLQYYYDSTLLFQSYDKIYFDSIHRISNLTIKSR